MMAKETVARPTALNAKTEESRETKIRLKVHVLLVCYK